MTKREIKKLKSLMTQLTQLEAKATKGPWFQWTAAGDISSKPEDCLIMQTLWTKVNSDGCTRSLPQGDADIKFVIAMRNNLAKLLDALEDFLARS